jgi:steroid delta-isomerase-like uncharacterized protein
MVSAEDRSAAERAIDDWAQAWSSPHDLERLVALFTDDVLYEDVPTGAVNHGKDELRPFANAFFAAYPDITFELTSRFASGSQGGAEWVGRGTDLGDRPGRPATGKTFEFRGASIFEFADGKIRRCSDYRDRVSQLKQLGLMPAG